jgi:hypothetical protein
MDSDRQMLVHKIERCEALVIQERARADVAEAALREAKEEIARLKEGR